MLWLIATSILGIIAVIAFVLWISAGREWGAALAVSVVAAIVIVIITIFSVLYRQQEGEAKVLRSFTGEVVGETYSSGMHAKAPWVSADTWDIRENTVSYVATGEESYDSGSVSGPRISVQDRDGVKSDIDITVRYSIDGDKVSELFAAFGSQENVTNKIIQPAIRSSVRKAPVEYSTLELLQNRADMEARIEKALKDEWRAYGITVDGIDMQEVVPPASISEANAQKGTAQAAIDAQQAKNEQQDLVNEQKIDNAKTEAQANKLISDSLTDDLIRLRQIEAYKDGTVYVVPDGSTPFIQPQ